ncbi:MAG: hypothetical protein MUO64_02285 [Anaerolineales bacterium]|nr:hypothetical protein [Anaerolineales bacterium]
MRDSYDFKKPEERRVFIVNTWPGTAGLAYAGYTAYGHGAIVFAPGHDKPMFVPLGSDFGNPEIERTIKEYDPEKEIVVIFFLIDSPAVFERHQVESMPPPLAFKTFSRIH